MLAPIAQKRLLRQLRAHSPQYFRRSLSEHLHPARGLLVGVALGTLLWTLIAGVAWALFT